MSSDPRIDPFPEYTSFFNKFIYATLPESTPPSQNIPPFQQMYMCDPPRIYPFLSEYAPFSTTIILCDSPRIYPSLPEYTLLFNKFICSTLPECTPPFQNIPVFQHLYATLPEFTPPSQNIPPFSTNLYVGPSQNLSPSPRIYPPFNNCMRHSQKLPFPSQKLPFPQKVHPSFSTAICPPPSQNISLVPFLQYSKNLPLSHWICPLF